MDNNIDLTKILKNCPKGWEFYSSVYGNVKFCRIENEAYYPIVFSIVHKNNAEGLGSVTERGLSNCFCNGECTFFPSKDQRDWNKFSAPWYKKEKFDPNTLKPFDKIIARNFIGGTWKCDLFSHIEKPSNTYCPYKGIGYSYIHGIPYNDDTKHLVGTKDEAPEYYRYWEN